MRLVRKRVSVVFLATILSLIAISVPARTAIADPVENLEFTFEASSGRPGYFVPITSSDPCPLTPGVTTVAKASFQSPSYETYTITIPVDQTTGEWGIGYSFKIHEITPLGTGWFYAYCWAGNEITGIYKEYPYLIEGVPPQYTAPTQIARGEQLVIESVDTCRPGNYDVQATLRRTSPWDQYSLGYPTIQGDYSWEISQEIPTGVPLGSYTIHIQCEGNPEVFYEQKVIEIVDTPTYVALGDSYSSGTGTFNYYSESGECYRSPDSYVPYVADQLNLGVPLFAACHGAQTADFYNQNPNTGEPAQISHLSEDTEVVTLTIGGNDAGFKDALDRCVHRPFHQGFGCKDDSSLLVDLAMRFDALAGTTIAQAPDNRTIIPLLQLYESIEILAPNAKIYVGGYPQLFGSGIANYTSNSSAPGGAQCSVTAGATVSYSDAQWLNQKADELNGIIANTVEAAQNESIDITFVPAALFTGYGLCDTYSPRINEVLLTDPPVLGFLPESLHPTIDGYAHGYGDAFVAFME